MRVLTAFISTALAVTPTALGITQSHQRNSPKTDKSAITEFRVYGGLANAVEGDVRCRCAGTVQRFQKNQALEPDDVVESGQSGLAEVLLDPGYYLRLSTNTQVRFIDLSPVNMKLKLVSGSVIIEVIKLDEQVFTFRRQDEIPNLYRLITINTPRDEYIVNGPGAYRFDVSPSGFSAASVFDGNKQTAAVVNRESDDLFDEWSRRRAASLAATNKALKKSDWYKRIKNDRAYLSIEDPEDSTRYGATRVVSARNGAVTFVEEAASLRPGESSWRELKSGDNLSVGERVKTAPESRAEIHPYPDFYFFVGPNSEIVYAEENDDPKITVLGGSVVVLARRGLKVKNTNVVRVVASGIQYVVSDSCDIQLNVTPGKNGELFIYSGGVAISGQYVKGPRKIVGTDMTQLSENDQRNNLYVWGRVRENVGAQYSMRRYLSIGGLWFFDNASAQYTFVPALREYKSPYGSKYTVKYSVATAHRGSPGVGDPQPSPRLRRP